MSFELPETGLSRVIGLLEILHDHGDEEETVDMIAELKVTLEELLPVTQAAELLGFIAIAGGKMRLSKEGLKIINCHSLQERKELLGKRVLTVEAVKKTKEFLQAKKHGKAGKKSVLKMLRTVVDKGKAEKTLKRVIEWGRHAGIIGYESDTEEIFIVE